MSNVNILQTSTVASLIMIFWAWKRTSENNNVDFEKDRCYSSTSTCDFLLAKWGESRTKRIVPYVEELVLNYHIKYFDVLDLGLLILRVDVYDGFHSTNIDRMIALLWMETSPTYQYLVEHFNPSLDVVLSMKSSIVMT